MTTLQFISTLLVAAFVSAATSAVVALRVVNWLFNDYRPPADSVPIDTMPMPPAMFDWRDCDVVWTSDSEVLQ